jgi:hypothetical protein
MAMNTLWMNGPPLLHELELPKCKKIFGKTITFVTQKKEFPCWEKNFSSFNRYVKTVARMMAWKNLTKDKRFNINPELVDRAEKLIIRWEQEKKWAKEMWKLKKNIPFPHNHWTRTLNAFIDGQGILRVGGSITNANIQYDQKHNIFIPNSRLADLIVWDAHQRNMYAPNGMVEPFIRQRFYITHLRQKVKFILRKCVICTKQKRAAIAQLMRQLPPARLQFTSSFSHCSIDLF